MALVEGRMLGVMVGRHQDLLVFSGSDTRIPLSPEGNKVFGAEAVRFERELRADQYQWKPDLRLNIRDLFRADARFPADCSFWLTARSLSVKDSSLVVRISSSNSRADAEVVLSPDLRIVSTRISGLNEFGWPD